MVVMAPKDENEMRRMLVTALQHNGPIAFRYPRGAGTGAIVDRVVQPIPIGKGELLQDGKDVLVLAIGRTVLEALDARSELSEKGISAAVVNCRFVKPIDTDLVCSLAKKIPRIITVEENVRQGGFGSAVLESLNDCGINGYQLERIGIADTFVQHGPQKLLRSKYRVDAAAIVETAKRMMASSEGQSVEWPNSQAV